MTMLDFDIITCYAYLGYEWAPPAQGSFLSFAVLSWTPHLVAWPSLLTQHQQVEKICVPPRQW